MGRQEAEKLLGLSGRYGYRDVGKAYSQKLSEWGARDRFARNVPEKKRATEMLKKIKEAQGALLVGTPPAQAPARPRPKSRPARKTIRRKVTAAPSSPAQRRPQPVPPAPSTPSIQPQPPRSPRTSQPSYNPAVLLLNQLPRALKVAAAILLVGSFLNIVGYLSKRGPSNIEGRKVVNASSSGRKRRSPVTVHRASRGNQSSSVRVKSPTRKGHVVSVLGRRSQGSLVVNTFPASEVLIDGRSIGYAPFTVGEKKALSAGRHRLVLRNHRYPAFSTSIEIEENVTREVRYWFDRGKLEILERG